MRYNVITNSNSNKIITGGSTVYCWCCLLFIHKSKCFFFFSFQNLINWSQDDIIISSVMMCCFHVVWLNQLIGNRRLFFFFFCIPSKYMYMFRTAILAQLPMNTLKLRQNGRHFPNDIFEHILFNENVGISIKMSLKCVLYDPTNNNPVWVQIMAWCQLGNKSLAEPMMALLIDMHAPLGLNVLKHLTDSFHWSL